MSFNYAHVLSSLTGRRGSTSSSSSAPASTPAAPATAQTLVPGEDYLRSRTSPTRSRSPLSPAPLSPNPRPNAPLSPTHPPASPGHRGRARPSSPVLLQPLPPSLTLEKEGQACSELELDRQTAQRRRERELAEALQDQEHRVERIAAREQVGTWVRRKKPSDAAMEGGEGGKVGEPFKTPPQAYELYQAIDKRDIDYIARVRDHAFNLLLQKNAGEFPVIYASRWGDTHRDVVILIVGAFSRYVNHLSEDDFKTREVQNTLKMLRANLKLAIDNALLPAQKSNLLSSYLQVLIMSEGDAWVYKSSNDLGLLLRDEESAPVAEAEAMVRRFSTKELRGVPGGVGDVEEYIANAALDLVIMASWGVVAGQIGAEPLPTYTFARDLRTYLLFREALDEHRNKLSKVSRRVRSIIAKLEELAGETRKGVRERLRDVREAIDKS